MKIFQYAQALAMKMARVGVLSVDLEIASTDQANAFLKAGPNESWRARGRKLQPGVYQDWQESSLAHLDQQALVSQCMAARGRLERIVTVTANTKDGSKGFRTWGEFLKWLIALQEIDGTDDRSLTTIELPSWLHVGLKIASAAEKRSMRDLIVDALQGTD